MFGHTATKHVGAVFLLLKLFIFTANPPMQHLYHVAAALGAMVIATIILLIRRTARLAFSATAAWGEGNVAVEALLPAEIKLMERMPAINTVTYFEGVANAALVRSRVAEIVKANPWLAGRLVTRDGVPTLAFPKVPTAATCTAGVIEMEHGELWKWSHDAEYSYEDIVASVAASHACVQLGKHCVGRNELLFKVTVVHGTGGASNGTGSGAVGDGWALVVSLSHVIADGHTYYGLLNMLSDKARVAALSPKRQQAFHKLTAHIIGEEELRLRDSVFIKLNVLWRTLLQPRYRIRAAMVDAAKVAAIKEARRASRDPGVQHSSGAVEFISTNDIVTSSFLRHTKARIALMAINFRGRLPCLADGDAGNYQGPLGLCTEDFATPELIRQAVSGDEEGRFVRAAHRGSDAGPTKLPGRFELASCIIAGVTNWSTFFRELSLGGGCGKQTLHLPCMKAGQVDFAFVFRPSANELAVLVNSATATLPEGPESPFGGTFDTRPGLRQ